MTGSYAFLRSPRWIAGMLLAGTVVVAFVNLGLWQLRRLDERRDHNALVSERMDAPAADLEDVTGPRERPDGGVWRRVAASGRYDLDGQVLVRNRTLEGSPGYHVLTPLVLDDGSAVYVNRGWVPAQTDLDEPGTGASPPDGRVLVEGLLVPGDTRAGIGPRDPDSGVLDTLVRADLTRLRQQYERPLAPLVLKLDVQDPATPGDLPVALPDPELSERNHLSYAVQWFLFSAITAVGFPVLVRRHARARDDVPDREPVPAATGPLRPG